MIRSVVQSRWEDFADLAPLAALGKTRSRLVSHPDRPTAFNPS